MKKDQNSTVKKIVKKIDSFLRQLELINEDLQENSYLVWLAQKGYISGVVDVQVKRLKTLLKHINIFLKNNELEKRYDFSVEDLQINQKNILQQIEWLYIELKIIRDDLLVNGLPPKVIDAKKELVWDLLHDEIVKVSKPSFDAERYGDAVYSAFKQIEIRVKQIYKECTGEELTGKPLMDEAFKIPKKGLPIIDITASENFQFEISRKNMQSGYHLIFAGAMMALRNPNAHEFVDLEETKAIHYLFFASQLMFILDNAICSKNET